MQVCLGYLIEFGSIVLRLFSLVFAMSEVSQNKTNRCASYNEWMQHKESWSIWSDRLWVWQNQIVHPQPTNCICPSLEQTCDILIDQSLNSIVANRMFLSIPSYSRWKILECKSLMTSWRYDYYFCLYDLGSPKQCCVHNRLFKKDGVSAGTEPSPVESGRLCQNSFGVIKSAEGIASSDSMEETTSR